MDMDVDMENVEVGNSGIGDMDLELAVLRNPELLIRVMRNFDLDTLVAALSVCKLWESTGSAELKRRLKADTAQYYTTTWVMMDNKKVGKETEFRGWPPQSLRRLELGFKETDDNDNSRQDPPFSRAAINRGDPLCLVVSPKSVPEDVENVGAVVLEASLKLDWASRIETFQCEDVLTIAEWNGIGRHLISALKSLKRVDLKLLWEKERQGFPDMGWNQNFEANESMEQVNVVYQRVLDIEGEENTETTFETKFVDLCQNLQTLRLDCQAGEDVDDIFHVIGRMQSEITRCETGHWKADMSYFCCDTSVPATRLKSTLEAELKSMYANIPVEILRSRTLRGLDTINSIVSAGPSAMTIWKLEVDCCGWFQNFKIKPLYHPTKLDCSSRELAELISEWNENPAFENLREFTVCLSNMEDEVTREESNEALQQLVVEPERLGNIGSLQNVKKLTVLMKPRQDGIALFLDTARIERRKELVKRSWTRLLQLIPNVQLFISNVSHMKALEVQVKNFPNLKHLVFQTGYYEMFDANQCEMLWTFLLLGLKELKSITLDYKANDFSSNIEKCTWENRAVLETVGAILKAIKNSVSNVKVLHIDGSLQREEDKPGRREDELQKKVQKEDLKLEPLTELMPKVTVHLFDLSYRPTSRRTGIGYRFLGFPVDAMDVNVSHRETRMNITVGLSENVEGASLEEFEANAESAEFILPTRDNVKPYETFVA